MDRRGTAGTPLRVGIAGSLSGVRVSHAHLFRRALRYLQRAGVAATLADDASSPECARTVAGQFCAAGVSVVIGHFNSACAQAALPVYREHGITVLLPAATAITLETGPAVHRLCGDDAGQARAITALLARLRRRDGRLAVQARIDHSAYAARVLACLQRSLGPGLQEVTGLDASAPPPHTVELVIATAAQAVAHVAGQRAGAAITIYADEAAVPEFNVVARNRPGERYIATPWPSYGVLLARGCGWIVASASGAGGGALAAPANGWAMRRSTCGRHAFQTDFI